MLPDQKRVEPEFSPDCSNDDSCGDDRADTGGTQSRAVRVRLGLARGLGVLCACVVGLLLIHWRSPCDESVLDPTRVRATLFSAFMLMLSAPCLYYLARLVTCEFLAVLLTSLHALLALFPYKILYPRDVDLCQLFFISPPSTVFGLGGGSVLVLYLVLACAIAMVYWRTTRGRLLPEMRPWLLLHCVVIVVLALVQFAVRYGDNSPKSLQRIRPDGSIPFHLRGHFDGVNYGGGDVYLHLNPSGLFRGVAVPRPPEDILPFDRRTFRGYGGLCINRRGLSPYLYSLVSTYLPPYMSAIAVNFAFYCLMLFCGHRLALLLGLHPLVALSYAVLLSCNYFILFQSIAPYFYIQYSSFIMAVSLGIVARRSRSGEPGWQQDLLFCSVLLCSGLTYDPFIFSVIVALWGLVQVVPHVRRGPRTCIHMLCKPAIFSLLPFVGQKAWETLLSLYSLTGTSENFVVRDELVRHLLLLPRFACTSFFKILRTVDSNLVEIVIRNPASTHDIEYWSVLGVVGVLSLFFIVGRYVDAEDMKALLVVYLSGVLLSLMASLVGSIPPPFEYNDIFLEPKRTNTAFFILILSQTLGLYHLVRLTSAKALGRTCEVSAGWALLCLVGVVYALSFVRLLFFFQVCRS